MVNTLLIGILLDLATAAWFVLVAMAIQRRLKGKSVMEEALQWSMVFWYGAAGFMLLDGGYALLTLRMDISMNWQLAVLLARRILFIAGTAALVHVLITMRTGNRDNGVWVAGYYVAVAVAVEAITFYQQPNGHAHSVWAVQFEFIRETPLWVNVLSGAAIFVPLGASAIWALTMYNKMPTRADRFYLAMFCYSIISFVIGVLIGFVDNEWYWYGIFENRLAFTIGVGAWLVMRPPWVARRMGVPRLNDLERFPSSLRTRAA